MKANTTEMNARASIMPQSQAQLATTSSNDFSLSIKAEENLYHSAELHKVPFSQEILSLSVLLSGALEELYGPWERSVGG
jgi:hypothetical protein